MVNNTKKKILKTSQTSDVFLVSLLQKKTKMAVLQNLFKFQLENV